MHEINIQKKMSCLFDSLSHFIKDKSALDLRLEICNFLRTDPRVLGGELKASQCIWDSGKSFDDYIAEMSRESTWGTSLEIACFTIIFNVDAPGPARKRGV